MFILVGLEALQDVLFAFVEPISLELWDMLCKPGVLCQVGS